jgi:hypothetical protein
VLVAKIIPLLLQGMHEKETLFACVLWKNKGYIERWVMEGAIALKKGLRN